MGGDLSQFRQSESSLDDLLELFIIPIRISRPVFDRTRVAGVAQLVEHHVAIVDVEGSSPFTRSS